MFDDIVVGLIMVVVLSVIIGVVFWLFAISGGSDGDGMFGIGAVITWIIGTIVTICNAVKKNEYRQKKAIEDEKAQEKSGIEEDRNRIEERKKKEKEELLEKKRIEHIEHYERSILVDSISKTLLNAFYKKIDVIHDSYNNSDKEYRECIKIKICKMKIVYGKHDNETIYFDKERYALLNDDYQRYAVAFVLSEKILNGLKEKYPNANFKSIGKYRNNDIHCLTEFKVFENTSRMLDIEPDRNSNGVTDFYEVDINYSESNPNYVEPQQW